MFNTSRPDRPTAGAAVVLCIFGGACAWGCIIISIVKYIVERL